MDGPLLQEASMNEKTIENKIKQDDWVSGLDTYLLLQTPWRQIIINTAD